uniref:Alpha-type protein kinase domain-containing protein n=1 Tax=Macrostomum lignano TaxID=282301 RepID=A0A1I8I2A9_9PLAT
TSSYAMLSINERIRWIFEQSELGYGRPTENEDRDEKVLTVLKKHFVGMEAIELRSSDALVEKILQDAYRRFRNAQVEICGIPNFTVATATPDLGAPDWKDAAAEDFQYHAIGVPASIQSIVDGSELSRTVFSVQVKKSARPFALQGLVAEYFALLKEGEAAWHKATVREFLVSDLKNTFKQPFVLLNTCEILQVATFLFQEFNRLNKIVRVVKPFTTAVIIPRTRRAGLDPALLCPFRFEKKLAGANQFEIIDDDWNPGEVTSANPVESDCRGAAGTGNSSSKQASSGNPEKHCFSASQRFKLVDPNLPVLDCFAHWTHAITGGYLLVEGLEIFTRCSKTLSDEASEALIKSAKIHCSDVTRFLPWNLGKSGIRRYLQKHECNDLCKKMGLRRVFMNM